MGWLVTRKGSDTSGNYGHKGVKGRRGGSAPGGGHMAIGVTPGTPQSIKADFIRQRREEQAAKKKRQASVAGRPADPKAGMDQRAISAVFPELDQKKVRETVFSFDKKERDAITSDRSVLLHNPSEGIHQQQVATAMVAWAGTSNDHDMRSLSLQEAASKEFGVPLSEYQKAKISQMKRGDIPEDIKYLHESNPAMLKPGMPREQEQVLLRSMYDHTQQLFQDAGYKPTDTVRVFRGVGTDQYLKQGKAVNMAQNAMSSWSLHPGTATDFGQGEADYGTNPRGAMLSMEVPVSSILSTPRTGFGVPGEGELVILGIPGNQAMVNQTFSKSDS